MDSNISIEKNNTSDLYQIYALLEKERNFLLLFKELVEKQTFNLDIVGNIKTILEEPSQDLSKEQREEFLKSHSASIDYLSKHGDIDKTSALGNVIENLKKTDEQLSALKQINTELSEKINTQRIGVRLEHNLDQAFQTLLQTKAGAALGLADPSYLLYIGSGSGGGTGGPTIDIPSTPFLEKLKSIAQALMSAHIVVISQALFGIVGMISLAVTELYGANKLQKRLDALNAQEAGRNIRFEKSILIASLFIIRAAVLGLSIGLATIALLTPVGAATLLMIGLTSYLFEELGHLRIERKLLGELRNDGVKEKLAEEIAKLREDILNTGLSVGKRLKMVDDLAIKGKELAQREGAIAVLEKKEAESIGRRNKTIYNAIGAALIILSPLFPPLFFVGLSMLLVPLGIGFSRYLDEKWNQGKLSGAIANSAVVQFITNSNAYKNVFGEKISRYENVSDLRDTRLNRQGKEKKSSMTTLQPEEQSILFGWDNTMQKEVQEKSQAKSETKEGIQASKDTPFEIKKPNKKAK